MVIMRDKLALVHQFLNEIIHTANEDELTRLYETYQARLAVSSKEEAVSELLRDGQMLGREILALKAGVTDAARNRKLAHLSAEERDELAEVEAIIDENRFRYHFQPIVSALDGSIYSYEALMRPESDKGMTPFHILKYAELTGRLYDIERATFLNVLGMLDSDEAQFRGRKIFINSIPKIDLKGSDLRRAGELLIKHSNTAVIELTEQTESDEDELNVLKDRYRNMGIETAIDDFGTGYSNLENLLRYMPNYVKIDRSLIGEIQKYPKKRYFVRDIIDFCHGSGIKVLAEGVETSEELHTVILMGVDLIQGFYTAKPAPEIIDSIPYQLIQEIQSYHQELQDGKDQQVYPAEAGDRIQLEKLVTGGYECILVEKSDGADGEVTVIGSPTLDTEVHIEIAESYRGKVVLENVHLSNVKNRPCIKLGDNSEVTVLLRGENTLMDGGIQVPEGARLTLEGDGVLTVKLNAAEYFGIGNDIGSGHGDLIFRQSGMINISASGKTGICIGSGLGGSITIDGPGKFVFHVRGNTGVGIGSLRADSRLDLENCAFEADLSLMNGIAVGSLTGNAEVRIMRSSTKLSMSGKEIAAIGTIEGDNAEVFLNNATVSIRTTGYHCTCVGSLNKNTSFTVDSAAFHAVTGGEKSLPFGGLDGNTKVSFLNADTSVKMDTDVDMEQYLSVINLEVANGRTVFSNHGNEIALNLSE